MKHYLCFLNFFYSTKDIISLAGVLVLVEKRCDSLDGEALVSCEISPFVSDLVEEGG